MRRLAVAFGVVAAVSLPPTAPCPAQEPHGGWPFADSRLPVEARVADLVARLTLEEKVSQLMHTSPAIPRLGIAEYSWWSEALHGVGRTTEKVTVFPQAIALAATFDPAAVERAGDAIATEARAIFNEDRRLGRPASMYRGLTVWSPNVNVVRDPRWGRGQETFGEDPFLTAQIGLAMVAGLQGRDGQRLKVSACAKHFAVHSGPEGTRHRFDARPSAYDLHDTYLAAFRELVAGGVSGVMCAYNRVGGQPCCANDALLTDTLRGRWGFSGYVTSDCWALDDFLKEHRTHATRAAAAADALAHGTDLECGGSYGKPAAEAEPGVFGALLDEVRAGRVSESLVDRALGRLLTIRMRLGLFDPPGSGPYDRIPITALDAPEQRSLALELARESIVLLKNDGATLPLDARRIRRIAVVGPNADDRRVPLGTYNGVPAAVVTALDAITAKLAGKADVVYDRGVDRLGPPLGRAAFRRLAARLEGADAVVFVGGISPLLEGEDGDAASGDPPGFFRGDRTTIAMPRAQTDLLEKLRALHRPLILVVMSGSALAVEREAAHADAIVQAWYGGQAGGEAVADVLFGDTNPAGRLPITVYRSDTDLPPFADYSMGDRTYRYFRGRPLFPFGHGLSYSTFTYGNLRAPASAVTGHTVAVSVTVRNTGSRGGDEVAQLYLSHPGAAPPVPIRSLRGFRRVHLEPGESREVEFLLTSEQLARVTPSGELVQAPGVLAIEVGGGQPGHAPTVSALVEVTGDACPLP